ncbi:hypothetical protein [Sphingopyxis sp.]|uniref:hypothetical protein n=1 Tax=Sphingopyxis sp. TaxID=1908224 RepID=UPI0025D8C6DC|nr:hypothetical protein [Sphingopyxis sp.]MBK6413383.1 hypothetical protein [Sphingopyxis sp.]
MRGSTDQLQPETQPGIATAEGELVFLDGPDGVATTMTRHAAAGTGQSLIAAAATTEREQEAADD